MTRRTSKRILSIVSVLSSISLLGLPFVHAQTSLQDESVPVYVEITAGNISIGIEDDYIDFGQWPTSVSNHVETANFSDHFWVQDMKGADAGYYTTVQLSGNLQWPGNEFIPAANLEMRVVGDPATLDWSPNTRVQTDTGIKGNWVSMETARDFIRRDNATNHGVIGRYGVKPEMRLDIPWFQSVGNYTGTLVYTLYEN